MREMTHMPGACLMCGSEQRACVTAGADLEDHTHAGQSDVVRCCACGHVYVHPLPERAQIAALYPGTYYTVNSASPLFLRGLIYDKKMQRDVARLRKLMADREVRSIVDI